MADWSYPVNDPAAVTRWSSTLYKQSIPKTLAWRLANISHDTKGEENIVQMMTDLQDGPGATVNYFLIEKLTGDGTLGDEELAGTEEAIITRSASMSINQRRHSVNVLGAMSQQRVPMHMRDTARVRLADWWAERLNIDLLNQATGNTFQTNVRRTGCNATVAPDTAHMVFANYGGAPAASQDSTHGHRTAEASGTYVLANGDTFDLSLLLDAAFIGETNKYPIKPIQLKGMTVNGVAILHPLQVRSAKRNFTAGQWGAIQSDAMRGGQITGNPIFNGAIGMYEGFVLHKDANVPYGVGTESGSLNALGTANVARGVVLGAQSLAMAVGRAYPGFPTKYKWTEEAMDGFNKLRVAAGLVMGVKKNVFNSQDFATITISSYEVA